MQKRKCVHCQKLFQPKSVHHFFCSVTHRQAYNKGKDWPSYFKRLLGNNAKERKQLSVDILEELYKKQNGRCVLSGVPLTKIVGHGQVSTNASIDRIRPGKAYTKGNIRLVCSFVNSFRGNLSDSEFKWWCGKISNGI